jgi:hypothetical protein
MRSTTTTLRAEWLSADESNVFAHGCLTAGAAALGCRSRVKTPFLFPPILVSTDSHGLRGGGEVGEVPHVLADDGLDVAAPVVSDITDMYKPEPVYDGKHLAVSPACFKRLPE